MPHNFGQFPELTNAQMEVYYFQSPHKQITEDFRAKVKKVIDGDTIRVSCDFRDFEFRVRLADIASPELNESGGKKSRDWLAEKIEGEEIDILINHKNRVGKWGRLIGEVMHRGMNLGEESIIMGMSVQFGQISSGIPKLNSLFKEVK